MRSHSLVCAGLIGLAVIGDVFLRSDAGAQMPPPKSPRPLDPTVLPPTPVGPIVPAAAAARKPTPFDRFRDYDKLPELTRQMVFSAQRGMEWLARDGIHQPDGRFIAGVNPALGKATDDDHFLRQALAAFALARSAKLTGDEKFAVRSGQTILSLLAEAPKDSATPALRRPAQSNAVCNRVGAAAYLAMAIFELPDSSADLIQAGEELCQFIRTQAKTDGSLDLTEGGEAADTETVNHVAGPALYALALSNRAAPAQWKADTLARGLTYYRKFFRANPLPGFVPWMTAAFADAHLQTKEPAYAEFVFEMNDWLRKLQYENPDPRKAAWRGGFPVVVDGKVAHLPPTVETAYYAQGFADACRMIRNMERPDADRYAAYRTTLMRSLQFLTGLQYGEDNAAHFSAAFRPLVVGAFHPTHADGNLRVDHTAIAVSAFAQFLLVGADR